MPTAPLAPRKKRTEATVLWLGFLAVIAIIASQFLTQKLLTHYPEWKDLALLPPMGVALIALFIILTISSRMHRAEDLQSADEKRSAELTGLRAEFNYLASKTIADSSTAIKWGMRALDPLAETFPPAEKHTFDHIRERNDANLEILRNLTILSRLEQKNLNIHPLDVDLRDTLRDISNIVGRATAAKGTTLIYVPPQEPVQANTDRVLLGDIILSLYYFCLNRTRGTSDALTIRCFNVPLEDGKTHARIIVADNAPPVPEAEREFIFDRVIKDRTSGATTGVNLGPHVAKQLADLLGITLAATVTEEQTSFTITF